MIHKIIIIAKYVSMHAIKRTLPNPESLSHVHNTK